LESYGFDLFDLETSPIDQAARVNRLLIVWPTTLWLLYLGDWFPVSGHRELLEIRHRRDYGYFRLGRDYIQRAQTYA